MKKTVFAFVLIVGAMFFNQTNAQQNMYDSILAKKLNADDYGMKSYVLVILKTGSATTADKRLLDSIFRGHMANIKRLADENKLVLAGPMESNDKHYEGIFVFNTSDTSEAKQWLSTDPAIQSKHLDAEIYAWYCTAALQQIPGIHKTLQKKNF